jgi:hypothetical protein
MTAAELLREVERHGGRLIRSGDGVRVTAPAPLPDDLMGRLREHKAELLAVLADATPAAGPLRDPSTPCPACGRGVYWHGADGWHCAACAPAPAGVERWRHVSGARRPPAPPSAPPPAVAWPDALAADLRRVAAAFEWTDADRRDFIAWARRSAQGLADAAEFLAAEVAKLPPPGLTERRRVVLAMLADDPATRVAWTCADDGARDPLLLTLAIRGRGTCELAIPRAGFDALALPQLIGAMVEQRGDE